MGKSKNAMLCKVQAWEHILEHESSLSQGVAEILKLQSTLLESFGSGLMR